MTPTYFYPTPLQLAALGAEASASMVWNSAHDASTSGYGYAIDARNDLIDRMGDMERGEFWTLFGALHVWREIARAILPATREADALLVQIEEELRDGYPDLIDADPSETYPASVLHLAKKLRALVTP